MTKEQIYQALNPNWWILQTSGFNTEFYSTEIVFNTQDLEDCTYTSSAPFQTNGLNAGESGIVAQTLIDDLRTEAAQRLFDMHATQITGFQPLGMVYNANN